MNRQPQLKENMRDLRNWPKVPLWISPLHFRPVIEDHPCRCRCHRKPKCRCRRW